MGLPYWLEPPSAGKPAPEALKCVVANLAVNHGKAAKAQAAEGVAVKNGDICILAHFQGTDAVFQAQGFGWVNGNALKGGLFT